MERESERERTREPEPLEKNIYEQNIVARRRYIERQKTGTLVVHAGDREWHNTRQGRLKFYLHDFLYDDIALTDWKVFINDVHRHSGKHRHQGGLVIFVLEGRGWSVIDGQRHDWQAGDLMLLPIKRDGGPEHQHFNDNPDKPCQWMAFIYEPYARHVASELVPMGETSE